MIKKLSLFFSAIAIGILSIFGSISTKNSAEPQYFLENTQVKNAVVEKNNNITLILDENVFLDQITSTYNFVDSASNVILTNNINETFNLGLLLNINLFQNFSFYTNRTYEYYYSFIIESNVDETQETINISNNNNNEKYNTYLDINEQYLTINNILKIEIINPVLSENQTIETINQKLNPYIGTLTELPQTQPLDQINTLVSDIVNWFTNIFNGLGNVFYDPTANKLTAWGTVMFIGVAIMLISMALKWVISLIRGV